MVRQFLVVIAPPLRDTRPHKRATSIASKFAALGTNQLRATLYHSRLEPLPSDFVPNILILISRPKVTATCGEDFRPMRRTQVGKLLAEFVVRGKNVILAGVRRECAFGTWSICLTRPSQCRWIIKCSFCLFAISCPRNAAPQMTRGRIYSKP